MAEIPVRWGMMPECLPLSIVSPFVSELGWQEKGMSTTRARRGSTVERRLRRVLDPDSECFRQTPQSGDLIPPRSIHLPLPEE